MPFGNFMLPGCAGAQKTFTITVNPTTENVPLAVGNYTISQVQASGSTVYYSTCTNNLIAKVVSNGGAPVNGSITANVWVEGTQPANYCKRHFEISPQTNAANATATITLYLTQADFDNFNLANAIKLPANSSDAAGKANLRIAKYSGTSSNGTGLPDSYGAQPTISYIDPDDVTNIVWNTTQSRWEITFDVAGFSGFFVTTKTSGALPLQLLSFSGTRQNGISNLDWQTANEENTREFVVERSSNASNWQAAGAVAARGSGSNTYTFQDILSFEGKMYYRLKMMDMDGKYSYSNVIWLSNKTNGNIAIYPNPTKEYVTIAGAKPGTKAILTDARGAVIKVIGVNKPHYKLDLSSLSQGTYFIRFEDGSIQRIIKQ